MAKKGAIDEIQKIVIVLVVLVIMAVAVFLLLGEKGFGKGGLLDSIRNLLRFGR